MGRAQIDMVRISQTWRSFDRPKIPVIQLASASLATGLAINYELSSFQEAGYTSTESLPAFSAWAKLANSFLLHVAVSEVYALKMRSRVFLFFVLLVCQSSWHRNPNMTSILSFAMCLLQSSMSHIQLRHRRMSWQLMWWI